MVYQIPEELKQSKERWFVIFTNLSLAVTGGAFLLGIGISSLLGLLLPIGLIGKVVIVATLTIIAYVMTSVRIGKSKILKGAGLLLYQKRFRNRAHRRNRAIYIPCFDEEDEDDDSDN